MDAIVWGAGTGRALAAGPVRLSVKEDGTHMRGTLGVAEFTSPPRAPKCFQVVLAG